MKSFILRPYEFAGTPFEAAAHAQTSALIEGQTRHFLLKMRDGVIYFREDFPSRKRSHSAPVYAVTRIFESEMRGDELIAQWSAEIERENYGRFVCRSRRFSYLAGEAILCIIHRRNRSGWIKENFDAHWLEFGPNARQEPLDLWKSRLFLHYANRRAAQNAHKTMVNRIFEPQNRVEIPLRWLQGSSAELRPLLLAILQLWAPKIGGYYRDFDEIPLQWRADGPTEVGGAQLHADFYFSHFQFSSQARQMLDFLRDDFPLQGFQWHNNLENPIEFSDYEDDDLMEKGNEQWGENWRGNWWPQTRSANLNLEPFSPPTAHERLEAALLIQPYLSQKIGEGRAKTWINDILIGFD